MWTKEIAQAVGVHVNTVRLYEQWGYISPVPRLANGYRTYSELHLQQMRIARLAFEQAFIQHNLRKMATHIVQLSGAQQFAKALQAAQAYEAFLQQELQFAKEAVNVAAHLLAARTQQQVTYSHRQVATRLGVSEDVLRNWERNGLYTIARNRQNRRMYTEADVQKLLIIRVLRSAHYSIASILQLFSVLHTVTTATHMRQLLNDASFSATFYHVTDELERNLVQAIANTKTIIRLLSSLK